MRRFVAYASAAVIAVALASSVLAFGYRAWRQHDAALALAIHTPDGIQEALFVELGGVDQWIQIRGEDHDNPVVLILAGGPGNSLVPLAPVFRSWERQFTVVQWDQRGAGKTYGRNGTNEAPMTIERMVGDGIELTQYLLKHLQKQKLVLVGHSWGTVLGVRMVKARPDLFTAYVGTGQVVAKEEKEEILYANVMERVRAEHDVDGLEKLEAIGAPPYKSQQDLLVEREVAERYDTDAERNLESSLRPVVLFAPGFSLHDIYSMLRGSKFAGNAMYPEMLTYDARTLGPQFAVPFFIFNGDKDMVTPMDLAMQYFETILAPQKGFVVLNGGGHSAMLTMPDVFLSELVSRVRPIGVLEDPPIERVSDR
jgi:pimeloyl-ACP methyl ester carboxylesterase